MADKLVSIVERYFVAVRDTHSVGAGVKERSYYPALAELLDSIGAELKPRVLSVLELGNIGVGHPDFGLFAANQVQKGQPRPGQKPERGVVEVKGVSDATWLTADAKQVSGYFDLYRLVIVTNLRDFLIVGEGPDGTATKLERFSLAVDPKSFWELVATPRKSAERVGRAFGEYLRRALTQSVSLREPKDVAWFLASYARDALQRVEVAGNLPALANVRISLEQALGVKFTEEKGDHFFRSTLVQTLFYGVFSAWVLWARELPRSTPRFDWHGAVWYLNVPFVRTLFQQLAAPAQLQPLRLVEVLDWTAATLNRIDQTEFFKRFSDADAVQFFYEPFLEAFDPDLRKELGVWYTPSEVVTHMVARVDKALRDDLGIADGLAAENVYVLDPCCGTGAFLAAILRRIDETLATRGLGALRGQMVKKAAVSRVFGFEIMPAPFVVAHLQVGLVLRSLGATLDTPGDRAGIYLTNALTGWEPVTAKPLPFPELEEERKRASEIKQGKPILVILGNPPYNGFAGMAVEEERALSVAYRTTKKVRRPEGQGLNDLYIRFFRMAERRIVKVIGNKSEDDGSKEIISYTESGEGIISFISNYSWLDGLSFTGMRERYLEAFDEIRIDCLNGDKYKTGKTTPEGKPDPSIFSTEHNREGIQVGTAISTLIRKAIHKPSDTISIRQYWGTGKRQALLDSANAKGDDYDVVAPEIELGLPFVRIVRNENYLKWPKLPELLPVSFPGVKTSRDEFLVAIDRDVLEKKLGAYFDSGMSHEDARSRFPSVMTGSGFDGPKVREALQKVGIKQERLIRYAYRPFDLRWVYWEPAEGLVDRAREEYLPHVKSTNTFLSAGARNRKEAFYQPQITTSLADHHLVESNVGMFPLNLEHGEHVKRFNLPPSLQSFVEARGLPAETIFQHVTAILHSPLYSSENAGALRMDWPRVPVPGYAQVLQASAGLGATLMSLLDAERDVPGVSVGALNPTFLSFAVPTKLGGGSLGTEDLAVSVGWGSMQGAGSANMIVMPGRGLAVERDFTAVERAALETAGAEMCLSLERVFELLGSRTIDLHLNAGALWSNVPTKVWAYTLGGYPVIKKWLSYREQAVLNRPLRPDEVAYVSEIVRRVAAILLMGPKLDANYSAAKASAASWLDGKPVA